MLQYWYCGCCTDLCSARYDSTLLYDAVSKVCSQEPVIWLTFVHVCAVAGFFSLDPVVERQQWKWSSRERSILFFFLCFIFYFWWGVFSTRLFLRSETCRGFLFPVLAIFLTNKIQLAHSMWLVGNLILLCLRTVCKLGVGWIPIISALPKICGNGNKCGTRNPASVKCLNIKTSQTRAPACIIKRNYKSANIELSHFIWAFLY